MAPDGIIKRHLGLDWSCLCLRNHVRNVHQGYLFTFGVSVGVGVSVGIISAGVGVGVGETSIGVK